MNETDRQELRDFLAREVEVKLCECGCGLPAPIAKRNGKNEGWIKGQPIRFISGHNKKLELNPKWKGGKTYKGKYVKLLIPYHPRANPSGYVMEHIVLAENALGKPIPANAEVHHYTLTQLVICEDHAYHILLHQRQRAYEACGNPKWLKCWICKEYDDPKNFYVYPNKKNGQIHRKCSNNLRKNKRLEAK